MSSRTVVASKASKYDVPPEVAAKAAEFLFDDLVGAFKSLFQLLKAVSKKVEEGEMNPASAAELITAVAWHVDRAIALISSVPSDSERTYSYEEIVTSLESARRKRAQ